MHTTPIINKSFYGFNINPDTKEIFAFDALDYQTNGKVYIYSSTGTEISNYETGLIPNSIIF